MGIITCREKKKEQWRQTVINPGQVMNYIVSAREIAASFVT